MKKSLLRLMVAVIALCLLLTGVSLADDPEEMPDFTLTDQYGNSHTLSDYRGKVVFLNFWATWCGPCRAEMPDFETAYHELGENQGDVIILGIAAPGTRHDPDYDAAGIASFLQDMEITYPVLMDTTGELFDRYITLGYPTSLFINAEGMLAHTEVGMMSENDLMEYLDSVR